MNHKEIISELTKDTGYYECGKVNFYNLATLIEELYSRVNELETQLKDARNGTISS